MSVNILIPPVDRVESSYPTIPSVTNRVKGRSLACRPSWENATYLPESHRTNIPPTPPAGTVELILSSCIPQVVSVNLERRRDGPGETDHVDRAWQLKERIHQREGVLKQRRGFFTDAYRRAATVLYFEDDTLVAFSSVRRDGYILFLAVAPEARGQGYGERLVAEIAEDYATITCHARTSNESALGFYQHLGFEIDRRIDSYYEDNGDAYYLKLGDKDGIRKRLSEFLRR